jgi:hypothetical protein
MPAKRRTPKHRIIYPDPIERLISGEPIEETEDNRQRLIEVGFFGDWPELPREIRQRALDVLDAWRAANEENSKCL